MKSMFDSIVMNVEKFLCREEIPKTGVRFIKNGKGIGILVSKTDFPNLYEFSVYIKENVVMKIKCPIMFDESEQYYNIETEITYENISEMALEITNVINELLGEYDIDMKNYVSKERLENE